MKERPILFSAPMVRAIIDGTKTQTRRIVKAMHIPLLGRPPAEGAPWYADPGDRLWVRETWCHPAPEPQRPGDPVWYRADFTPRYGAWESDAAPGCVRRNEGPWKPSIHMPRWASRITLEVTSVRVERLHGITEEDARAEGVTCADVGDITAWRAFCDLWKSINGAESWAANPWVWVVGFKRKRAEVPRG